jgi:glycosyltransferase involved in cell wall biosynthesis
LIISGIVQDQDYFNGKIAPHINDDDIVYVGSSGPLKRDEWLGQALALLHPINFEEPFGLSVAEAMFCGTPVIAFNRGSMAELIDDGRTGFLCANIDEAVSSVEKCYTIERSRCRDRAILLFSKERMVNDYLRIYEKILTR